MTSPQHALWIRRGSQWQLALPLTALRDRMRRYGYTVYDIGNEGHLDHQPPEDHTPYSETGWPGTTPYGWVTAIDIMPPPGGSGLPSLQQLGGQVYSDRMADLPAVSWLKYMNWGPVSDGSAVHDQWQPNHIRRSSGDVGHIHLSCRSDVTQSTVGNAYDPVARLRGLDGGEMLKDETIIDPVSETLVTGEQITGPQSLTADQRLMWAHHHAYVARKVAEANHAAIAEVKAEVAAIQVTPTPEQWASLTAAVEAKVDTAVLAALQSEAGQAALVAAANKAEDS